MSWFDDVAGSLDEVTPPESQDRDQAVGVVKALGVQSQPRRYELLVAFEVEGGTAETGPIHRFALSPAAAALLLQKLRAGLDDFLG